MKGNSQIVIYGSYGYTGNLIVAQCKEQQLNVILAGRNEIALKKQSEATGYPYQVVEIRNSEELNRLLEPATLIIHCGGPFQFTAQYMIEACLKTRTHYTDITGEIDVFELIASYDLRAKKVEIMMLPGAGFDVVPSDCLALHLKKRLSNATHLELAFTTTGAGSSRGTSKTAVLGLGEGSRVRRAGQITKVPLHEGLKEIDYGKFKTISARIPWGDVFTAYLSTGIPNIQIYMGINKKLARLIKLTQFLNWLLRQGWLKKFLLKKIDQTTGPGEDKRENAKSYLVGSVWNNNQKAQTLLETPNGYTLTALSSVSIAKKILDGNFKTGFQTPSLAYGSDLILEFDGVKRTDL
ncbi:MAG: saccharopine dehydrogenase NADP-binding domain-containing protein [Cyclobacteriaceae bacterium]|nr:saccharopine dehydrogenase NADP-binding domain-containing protein [Cyclobacteriaceae bacterium]